MQMSKILATCANWPRTWPLLHTDDRDHEKKMVWNAETHQKCLKSNSPKGLLVLAEDANDCFFLWHDRGQTPLHKWETWAFTKNGNELKMICDVARGKFCRLF